MTHEQEYQIPHGLRNPFKVPEEYFSTLADRVMHRIQAEDKQPALRPNPFLRWMPFWGAACVAVLLVVFTQGLGTNLPCVESASQSASSTSATASQDSDAEDAFEYLTANIPYDYYAYDTYNDQ